MAVILSKFGLNQMSIDLVVGRGGAGEIKAALSEGARAGQSVKAQLGVGGGCAKQRGIKAKKK